MVTAWAVDPQQLCLNTGPKASIMVLSKGKRLNLEGRADIPQSPFSCWAIWKGNKRPGLETLVLCLFMIWFSLARFCPLFSPPSPEWTPTLAGLPFLQAPCYNLVWESLYVYFVLTFCGTLHYFKPTSTYFFFLKSRLAPLSSAGVGGGVPSS